LGGVSLPHPVLLEQVLHNKQSVATLAEALEDASHLGKGESPIAVGIRKRLEDAKDWDIKATAFFSRPGRCELAALEVPSTPPPLATAFS